MKRQPITATTLARFMNKNELKAAEVAREAGVSRQHLYRIRKGEDDPAITIAARIINACGRLLSRKVTFDELFDASDPQGQRRNRRSK
jgi:DNA-binding XRE family transcriptional regulator